MFERFSDDEDKSDKDCSMSREATKGILCSGENAGEIAGAFEDDKINSFSVEVSIEQLSELSRLECYKDGYAHENAYRFAKRWDSMVSCNVTVTDSEDSFQVRLNDVTADSISNEMIRDFAQEFRTDVHSTFDRSYFQ